MARRKVKNGVKKLGRKTQTFSGTNQKAERRRPFGTGLVRHCPQGLFSPFFTFLRAIFFRPFRLSLAPLSAPGSPRMGSMPPKYLRHCRRYCLWYFTEIWGYNAAGNRKHRLRAKLSSSQLRKHSGSKAWHGLCYQRLLFSYQNRVAGSSAAYKNQASSV